jgi:Fibronectin type III domain
MSARGNWSRLLVVAVVLISAAAGALTLAVLMHRPPVQPPALVDLSNPAVDKDEKVTCSATTSCAAGALTLTYAGDSAFVFVSENGTAKWTGSYGQPGVSSGNSLAILAWSKGGPGATNLNETILAATLLPNAGSTNFFVNASASATYVVDVVVLDGVSAAPIDSLGTGTNGHGTAISASATVSSTSDLLLMGQAIGGSEASTAGSGSTLLESTATGTYSEGSLDATSASTGSIAVNGVSAATKSWVAEAISVELGGKPHAPTGVTQSATTTTSMTLSWSAPLGPVINYTAYRYTQTACSGTQFSTATTSPTTTLGSLTAGSSRWWEVDAWNSTGEGTRTSCVFTETLTAAPTGVTVTASSETSVTVSWTNPAGTLSGELVFWEAGSSCSSPTEVQLGSVVTSDLITGLVTGNQYCAYVEAVDVGGDSAASSTATGVTDQVPAAPTGLTVGLVTTSTIPLSWTDPSGGGETNGTVYAGPLGCAYNAWYSVGSSTPSFVATGFPSATSECLGVSEWNGTGDSPISVSVTGTTLPLAPTGVTIGTVTDSSIEVSWGASSGTILNYTLQEASSCSASVWIPFGTSGTSDVITGLPADSYYCYQVIAWSAGGQSAASAQVSTTTLLAPAPPGPPENFSLIGETTTTITFSWNLPPGPLINVTFGFGVGSCLGNPSFTNFSLGVVSRTTVVGLEPGTTYSGIVSAWNLTGHGAESDCLTVTSDPPSGGGLLESTGPLLADNAWWVLLVGGVVGGVIIYTVTRRRD